MASQLDTEIVGNPKIEANTKEQSFLISVIVRLSTAMENVSIENLNYIGLFFIVPVLIQGLISALLLLAIKSSSMPASPNTLIFSYLVEFLNMTQQNVRTILLWSVLVLLISGGLFFILIVEWQQKCFTRSLYFLIFNYAFASIFLFMEISTLIIVDHYSQESSSSPVQHSGLSTIIIIIEVLTWVNILLTILLAFLYKCVAQTNNIVCVNSLCSRPDVWTSCVELAGKISLILVVPVIIRPRKNLIGDQTVFQDNNTLIISYVLTNLFAVCYNLKKQLNYFTFFNVRAARMNRLCLSVRFGLLTIILVALMLSSELTTIAVNYTYILIALSGFCFLTLQVYCNTRSLAYRLKSIQQISNPAQAVIFILQLNSIFHGIAMENVQEGELFMLKSLEREHRFSCSETACWCRKARGNGLEQIFRDYQNLTFDLMDKLCVKYSRSSQLIQIVLQIKLHVHHNFVGSCQYIKFYSSKQCSTWIQTLFLQKYSLALEKFLSQKQNQLQFLQTQKCIACEQLIQQVFQKFLSLLKFRTKFWGSVSKGVIDQSFQSRTVSQLVQMRQIHALNQFVLDNYQTCSILVSLLIAYEKYILMKSKVSKELVAGVRKYEKFTRQNTGRIPTTLGTNEMMRSMMYSSSSCTIEACLNDQNLGDIIMASKNVRNVFGYMPHQLIGLNINTLMAKNMQEQHTLLMRKWKRTSSWVNIGHKRSLFCLDKNNVCFSSQFYLKPVQRSQSINLMGCFFKGNDLNYMLLDSDNVIVAAGRNFIRLLGPSIINLPINFICQDSSVVSQCRLKDNKTFHRLKFYETKGKQELFKLYHNRKYSMEPLQCLTKKIIDEKQSVHEAHFVQFQLGAIAVGRLCYKVIQMCNMMEIQQDLLTNQTKKNQASVGSDINGNQAENKFVKKSLRETETNFCWGEEGHFLMNDPSISSSGQELMTSALNIISRMESIFYGKETIWDRRAAKITIIVAMLCFCGIAVDATKIYMNQKGFNEMRQLFFADGACSDDLQLTMLIYNRALSISEKAAHYERERTSTALASLERELQELREEQEYMEALISSEIVNFNKYVTDLTGTRMFKYQNSMVKWKIDDGREQEIFTTVFMANFLQLSTQVSQLAQRMLNSIVKENNYPSDLNVPVFEDLALHLGTLQSNFPQLQAINRGNLFYYASILLETKAAIQLNTFVKTGFTLAIFLGLLVILWHNLNFRSQQKYSIYRQYKNIKAENASALLDYYMKLRSIFKKASRPFQDPYPETPSQSDYFSHDAIFKLKQKLDKVHSDYLEEQKPRKEKGNVKVLVQADRLNRTKIFYLALFVLLLGLNVLMYVTQADILDKTQEIVGYINDLMNSENQLMESYFQIKASHRILAESGLDIAELGEKVNRVEVKFTKVAVSSLQLFQAYDPGYVTRMVGILTQSICELTKDDLSPERYQNCLKDEEMKIIEHGVINGMNYFGRQLQSFFLQSLSSSSLESASFSQVDKILFHMFKVYQKTQTEITNSLTAAATAQKQQYHLLIILEILAFLGLIIYSRVLYLRENVSSKDRIGQILLFPAHTLKNEPRMLKNFEAITEYHNLIGQ